MEMKNKKLKPHISFLRNLATATPSERKILIENASDKEMSALTEIAMNITKGHFPVSDKHFHRLKRHKHIIRKLASIHIPHKAKKIILKQKGGFLPILVAPILSTLGAIAGRLISHHLGLS
jgi:hypothetical protein